MTSEIFGPIYARGGAAQAVTSGAWLNAMVQVEVALALANAAEGLIPQDAAQRIDLACRPAAVDLGALVASTAANATPVLGLVTELRRLAGADADHVHVGATSQDIVDTAAMLVSRRACEHVLDDCRAMAVELIRLAGTHRDTPMMGRTLLQHATPTTFGLRAATWLAGLGQAADAVSVMVRDDLPVQMGGPVGTRSPAVAGHVARRLQLAEPTVPWHTIRIVPARLAGALGCLAGALSKIAVDVALLSQTEVGELRDGSARGGSSAMPHKRNPVAAVAVSACGHRVPGLVGTLHATMAQEHERAAGAWQAEWGTLTELLSLVGSMTSWGRDLLENLVVDADRMGENLRRAERGLSPADAAGVHQLIDRALAAHGAEDPVDG